MDTSESRPWGGYEFRGHLLSDRPLPCEASARMAFPRRHRRADASEPWAIFSANDAADQETEASYMNAAVRVILILPDGRPVEVDPQQCGPTVRLALRELVREILEQHPTPTPPSAPMPRGLTVGRG